MISHKKVISAILCISLMVVSVCIKTDASDAVQNKAAGVIRLGYVEGDEYGPFAQLLLDMALEFVEEGSIDKSFAEQYKDVDYEEKFSYGDTRKLWNAICDANKENARYRFVREVFFDLEEMDEDEYSVIANRDDVDIMISMGTVSGVYLAENEKKTKFMNLFSANPVDSGIIKSLTERYNDYSYALVDPTTYNRQMDASYKFLGFKKLGIVYEDSEAAYQYSAIDIVKQKAEEYGFEVVCEYVDEPLGEEEYDWYYSELKKAYRKLVDQGIDCLLITVASIDYESKMQELLDDAIIPAGVMTIAQDGTVPVAYGALFGVTLTDCEESAKHVVKQIRDYNEEGVPFDQLEMVYESTPRLAVNYTTASRIGFEIPFKNLQIVDYIYRDSKQ
ncbi:MAG: hypothetical protein K6G27_05015 [Lachnospiraceae bacterium]|nr:hypothetical protein [Lachnospiraceae bacterium]